MHDRNDHSLSHASKADIEKQVLQSRILIVDDMALMRRMIGMCLEKAGFTNLHYAEDGDECLDAIADNRPDLVVLDLNMPRLSGFEVCKQLRSQDIFNDMPILVQSASDNAEERVQVFAMGATDFVSKPINQQEMIARVKMHLENRYLIDNLRHFEKHMRTELSMARDMQHSLIPDLRYMSGMKDLYGINMDAVYEASFELGGDLWGFLPIDDKKFGVFVFDMSGHGVGASLNTFRAHAFMERLKDDLHDPALFLTKLNAMFLDGLPLGQFATMFYGVVDCENDKIIYAGAGAPRPFIIKEDSVSRLDSSGVPIGISHSPDYTNKTEAFMPGEGLFCYSDVLLETRSATQDMLGEDGLVDMVQKHCCKQCGDDHLQAFIKAFAEIYTEPLEDDLTALMIERRRT